MLALVPCGVALCFHVVQRWFSVWPWRGKTFPPPSAVQGVRVNLLRSRL